MVTRRSVLIDDRYSNPSFSTGYPSGAKPSYSTSEKRSVSYYLNAGYAYDDRYLLDVNLRSDGSSRVRFVPAIHNDMGGRNRMECSQGKVFSESELVELFETAILCR